MRGLRLGWRLAERQCTESSGRRHADAFTMMTLIGQTMRQCSVTPFAFREQNPNIVHVFFFGSRKARLKEGAFNILLLSFSKNEGTEWALFD